MGLRKDIWISGIIKAPIAQVLNTSDWSELPRHFLPVMPKAFQFRADPFGVWHDNCLHIFLEVYDYRNRIGEIELLVYDSSYRLVRRGTVLREPWHLSYPCVFDAEGAYWMLPEAHRSGGQTLYRATQFPDRWEPACRIDLGGEIAVDATMCKHEGRWWLFYTPVEAAKKGPARLHVASAQALTGPWSCHPQNPIRVDAAGARPGGAIVAFGDRWLLPVQECTSTYGGAIRPLWIERLTPDRVDTRADARLDIPREFSPYTEGMHTLSAVGHVTLFDLKKTVLSPHGLMIEVQRELKKKFNRPLRTSIRSSPDGDPACREG